jgi:protein-tyrosine phosphatase
MAGVRDLDWDGCLNARDLGGLAVGGGHTRWGAVVRADHPSHLTPAGWAALRAHGIRTLVSLETSGLDPGSYAAPGLAVEHVAVEDGADADFAERWATTGLWATPLYFADALDRWPDRHAAAVRAVARARPGGVLIHCGRGCDRTGIVALLLLAAVGVAADDIADDYARSAVRLAPREPGHAGRLRDALAARGTTVEAAVRDVVHALDAERYLLDAGLAPADLAALRARMVTDRANGGPRTP